MALKHFIPSSIKSRRATALFREASPDRTATSRTLRKP
ncbi:rCG36662 [Rattus norvegicus]|uniref:RCG36662 n=1 Tax=Rattus norvegicus TaxID=10116 RepID=A6JS40_RAT|nr:rCG36662 [Rattus norvegicus]